MTIFHCHSQWHRHPPLKRHSSTTVVLKNDHSKPIPKLSPTAFWRMAPNTSFRTAALASTAAMEQGPPLADSQRSISRGSLSPWNEAVCRMRLFYRLYWLASAPRYEHCTTPCPSIALSPQETTAICSLWSGNLHLEVEDICRVPLFKKTLKLKTTKYGLPGVSEFKSLLT